MVMAGPQLVDVWLVVARAPIACSTNRRTQSARTIVRRQPLHEQMFGERMFDFVVERLYVGDHE
jgi:hypothetical protein